MSSLENWKPKTSLGMAVAEGRIVSLDEIFSSGKKIKESQIIDKLVPNLKTDVIFIGGSPGKGGGIKRTPTRRTARMHRSGRRYRVSAFVIVGNGDGYIGAGRSVSTEHKVAIDKATEVAKLNIIPVKRGCGSWECGCEQKHSIPAKVMGKSGSVRIELIPAPKGIGLCIPDEGKKMMRLTGIKDIWAKSFGNTGARVNYALALYDAFKKLNKMKMKHEEKGE